MVTATRKQIDTHRKVIGARIKTLQTRIADLDAIQELPHGKRNVDRMRSLAHDIRVESDRLVVALDGSSWIKALGVDVPWDDDSESF